MFQGPGRGEEPGSSSKVNEPSTLSRTSNREPVCNAGGILTGWGRLRGVLFHGGDITGLEGSLGRQSLPGGAKVQRLQAVADRWNQGAKGLEGNRK